MMSHIGTIARGEQPDVKEQRWQANKGQTIKWGKQRGINLVALSAMMLSRESYTGVHSMGFRTQQREGFS